MKTLFSSKIFLGFLVLAFVISLVFYVEFSHALFSNSFPQVKALKHRYCISTQSCRLGDLYIENDSWLLIWISGPKHDYTDLAELNVKLTLTNSGSNSLDLSIQACNNISYLGVSYNKYALDLTGVEGMSTLMYCEGLVMDVETALTSVFSGNDVFELKKSEDGELLTFNGLKSGNKLLFKRVQLD